MRSVISPGLGFRFEGVQLRFWNPETKRMQTKAPKTTSKLLEMASTWLHPIRNALVKHAFKLTAGARRLGGACGAEACGASREATGYRQ